MGVVNTKLKIQNQRNMPIASGISSSKMPELNSRTNFEPSYMTRRTYKAIMRSNAPPNIAPKIHRTIITGKTVSPPISYLLSLISHNLPLFNKKINEFEYYLN